jgi:hypothetical protein
MLLLPPEYTLRRNIDAGHINSNDLNPAAFGLGSIFLLHLTDESSVPPGTVFVLFLFSGSKVQLAGYAASGL